MLTLVQNENGKLFAKVINECEEEAKHNEKKKGIFH
jgi:hypothetical protein